jgi:hypothetical protein
MRMVPGNLGMSPIQVNVFVYDFFHYLVLNVLF